MSRYLVSLYSLELLISWMVAQFARRHRTT